MSESHRTRPTIGLTLLVVKKLFSKGILSSQPSLMMPILGNMDFRSIWEHGGEKIKHCLEFISIGDLITVEGWPSVEKLQRLNEENRLPLWSALQLAQILRKLYKIKDVVRPLENFEILCREHGPLRHTLSKIYRILTTQANTTRLTSLTKWGDDLNRERT